jgi:hypothetical protein
MRMVLLMSFCDMTPCMFLNFILSCMNNLNENHVLTNEKALLRPKLGRSLWSITASYSRVSRILTLQQPSCFRCCLPLPGLTNENERVIILKHLNDDSSKHNLYDTLKMVCMIAEIRTFEDYNLADIWILDCQNFTAADALKWTLPTLKKLQAITFVSSEKNCVISNCYSPSYLKS